MRPDTYTVVFFVELKFKKKWSCLMCLVWWKKWVNCTQKFITMICLIILFSSNRVHRWVSHSLFIRRLWLLGMAEAMLCFYSINWIIPALRLFWMTNRSRGSVWLFVFWIYYCLILPFQYASVILLVVM